MTGIGTSIPSVIGEIDVTPVSITFTVPQIITAGPTLPKNVTITNVGAGPLTISGVSLTGPNAGEFAISSDTSEAILAPTLSRTVQVVFDPNNPGGSALRVSDDPIE